MRIKQLLAEKGVTAKALALSTGLTEMGLSKIITGKSSPNADTIQKIASALNTDIDSLFVFKHKSGSTNLKKEILKYVNNAGDKELEVLYRIILALFN